MHRTDEYSNNYILRGLWKTSSVLYLSLSVMYKEESTIDCLLNRLAHEMLTDISQTVMAITNQHA